MAESKALQERPFVSSNSNDATSATTGASQIPPPSYSSDLPGKAIGDETLRQLARQVEYYFSATNLSKDTYVSTLRSLNDGYVPVTIIANFGKVRSLVPHGNSPRAVWLASQDHSELLEVVPIDPSTGKRASPEGPSMVATVQAVGPIGGEPIPASKLSTVVAPAAPSMTVAAAAGRGGDANSSSVPVAAPVQNTVVLRDVPDDSRDADIREVFAFDGCPTIRNIHKDVANCWFVTMDTDSRDDMLKVISALRTKTHKSGGAVKARVKTGVAINRDSTSQIPYYPAIPQRALAAPDVPGNGRKNKKKKSRNKSRGGGGNKNANAQQNNGGATDNTGKSNNASGRRRSSGGGNKAKGGVAEGSEHKSNGTASESRPPPPSLGGENFPPLPSDFSQPSSNKVEVEKIPTHYELGRKFRPTSDASSTATTSTSSSNKSPPLEITPVAGGYAAALRKAAAARNPPERPGAAASVRRVAGNKGGDDEEKRPHAGAVPQRNGAPAAGGDDRRFPKVDVRPPSWGHGSFADVLLQQATTRATTARASNRSS